MNFKRLIGKLAFASFLATQAIAQDKAPEQKVENTQEVEERFLVLGRVIPENGTLLTGSSARIEFDDINRHQSADINRMLRQIPGVYVREEDGYGMFPNIALRGVNSHRSSKISIMEDGITAAPAPYSEPSAYYAPNSGRMNGIEVIKGAASVKYGPNTSGGVVNYLSTPIPTEETFYLKQLFGNYGEFRTHAYYGDSLELESGRFSYLFETYYRENNGFRDIQFDSNETGIENQFEPMLKLRWEPKADQYQFFEFKIGYSDTDSNLTYNGLERDDFNDDPHERYWGSRWAFMDTESVRTYLRHYIELDQTTTLTNTLYYNRFTRNWYKRTSGTDDAAYQGTGTGDIVYKNNNRDYYQVGLMTDLTKEIDNHTLSIGTKFHHDRFDDDSWNNTYTIGAPRTVTGFTRGSRAADATYMYTDAFSVYAQDEIAVTKQLTLTPGVRYEHIRYNLSKGGTNKRSDVDIWLPSLGFAYDFNENWQLFGGIHKAASVPHADDHANGGVTYERSINYELGLRHFADDASYGGEAVIFFNDISDVYDGKSIASGTTTGANVGDSETYGLELSAFADLGKINNWDFENPWRFAFTYTHAEITDVEEDVTKGTNGFFTGAVDGNDMPYIPDVQYSIGTGIHFKKFGFDIDVVFVDEAYVTGDNTDELDARTTVDLSGYYKVNDNFTIIASVLNVFDEEYEAAHHPSDIRAGAPMTFNAGFEVKF